MPDNIEIANATLPPPPGSKLTGSIPSSSQRRTLQDQGMSLTLKPSSREDASMNDSALREQQPNTAARANLSPSIRAGTGTDSEATSQSNVPRRRKGPLKRKIMAYDASSRADSISVNSGFMSRANTKKKSVNKRGGKRSVSIAM